jgi:hypothetical protein
MQRLYVRDPATGKTHMTSYTGAPPQLEWLAWAPDNAHLLVLVRTGTQVHVGLVEAFTVTDITSGSRPCGNPQSEPTLVAYAGGLPVVALHGLSQQTVASCSGGSTHTLFTLDDNDLVYLDGAASGAVIVNPVGGDSFGSLVIWSGGEVHRISTGTCASTDKAPYKCAQFAAW